MIARNGTLHEYASIVRLSIMYLYFIEVSFINYFPLNRHEKSQISLSRLKNVDSFTLLRPTILTLNVEYFCNNQSVIQLLYSNKN